MKQCFQIEEFSKQLFPNFLGKTRKPFPFAPCILLVKDCKLPVTLSTIPSKYSFEF